MIFNIIYHLKMVLLFVCLVALRLMEKQSKLHERPIFVRYILSIGKHAANHILN